MTQNITLAAINLVIGNKSFFVNDDDSWINKQNNTDRNRSNRNSNNRMRNSNRNNYQNDSFETYKFNFGRFDGIRVTNIISSICNSTNINGRSMGRYRFTKRLQFGRFAFEICIEKLKIN